MHLQRRRIPCESLNSKMGEKERKRVLADLSCKVPDTRFMYVTPEQGGNSIAFKSFWQIFLAIIWAIFGPFLMLLAV